MQAQASPGFRAGCGLKRFEARPGLEKILASPGFRAGCGLKPALVSILPGIYSHHPAFGPGAD